MGKEGSPIEVKVGEGIGIVKQEVEGSRENSVGGLGCGDGESRVWTMQDLYKHSSARGYSRDLCNFAWARAVQKKCLDDVVLSNVNGDEFGSGGVWKLVEEVKEHGEGLGTGDGDRLGDEKVEREVESENEEGELEEGEIDMDMDVDMNVPSDESGKEEKEGDVSNDAVEGEMELDCGQIDDVDFDERMLAILDTLDGVTIVEVEKSFGGICSELLNTLNSVKQLVLAVPAMDSIVQLFLTAVATVDSVYCSMSHDQKEQCNEIFRRLLSDINSQRPIFSPAQLKDIQEMLSRTNVSNSSEVSKANMYISKVAVTKNTGAAQFPKKTLNDSSANGNPPGNDQIDLPEYLKISTSRSKGIAPLLDLPKDHDLDSLPSPTSKSTSQFSNNNALPAGNWASHLVLGSIRSPFGTPSAVTHSFQTESLKEFSSYQQSFGGYERLPSPTPSEDNEDNECHSGINSSVSPPSRVNPSHLPNTLTVPSSNASDVQRPSTVVIPTVSSSVTNTIITFPSRSRDPRLRHTKLDVEPQRVVGRNPSGADPSGGLITHQSKVNRRVEDSNQDGPGSKRKRNEFSNSNNEREMISRAGTGGWLDDNDTSRTIYGNQNQTSSTCNRLGDPRIGVAAICNGPVKPDIESAPLINNLHSLRTGFLENNAVNPTSLFELLKNGSQQNVVQGPRQKCNDPRTQIKKSGVPGSITRSTAGSNVSLLHPTTMTSKLGDKGVIRMKPRDPRRVLLGGKLQSATLHVHISAESNRHASIRDPESLENVKPVSSQVAATAVTTVRNTENPKNVTCTQSDTNSRVASESQFASTLDERKTDACSMSEDVVAGLPKSPSSWGDVEHLFDGYDDQQRAAIQKERARRLDEQKKMFAERKLCLVLDLDHTLLNSAKFGEIDTGHQELLRKKEEHDREKPYRHLFRFPYMAMWTKLRPGIWNFLEKASKLFELHLYTMGNKSYATEMAKILDPKGTLFAGRVISKGDDGDNVDGDDRVSKTKDLEGVLGMESSVVIIDDSIRVWPHNKLNLIVVERYIYFPCSRRQFGLPGPSLLEIDHDERPEDGTLASSLAVIERLHKNFFSHQELNEVDVRAILSAEQRKILRGCRIVFSRVFPVGEASPHFHPLWQTAEQFGASCTNQIDDKVTHVVAHSLGTDKVKWALSTGRYVVHPNWVEASALLYRRVNEQDFAIKP